MVKSVIENRKFINRDLARKRQKIINLLRKKYGCYSLSRIIEELENKN